MLHNFLFISIPLVNIINEFINNVINFWVQYNILLHHHEINLFLYNIIIKLL